MALAPETYPLIITEENRLRAKLLASDFAVFCKSLDRLLELTRISDFGNPVGSAEDASVLSQTT
jgi:hypothetical protein